MKPSTKPIVSLLIWIFLFIIVSLACNFPGNQVSSQKLEIREEAGTLLGSYQTPDDQGGNKILFTVSEAGQATFQLDGAPDSERLTVDLIDEQTAGLSWQGSLLDGMGELTGEEQTALENLLVSELGKGLAMVPLDAACQGDGTLTPKQLAALLVPLQMQFKYAISNRSEAALELAAASSCDYGDREENQSDRPTQILFSPSMPVPVVYGYFPFDDVGSVEIPASSTNGHVSACMTSPRLISDSGDPAADLYLTGSESVLEPAESGKGPCNATCRGACGADCEPENCTRTVEHRCERDEQGRKTTYDERWLIYECGMHQGCIEHDACYDSCNEIYGCDSWLAAACRHQIVSDTNWAVNHEIHFCDQKAIITYGLGNAYDWAYGGGDQPLRETFEYRDEEYGLQQNFRKCNVPDEPTTEGPVNAIPVGVYNGAVKVEGWFLVPEKRPVTEVIMNNVRFQVTEDGSVSGTLELIYDAEFTTSRGNIVETVEVYKGTFSGQLTVPSGTVDLLLINQTSSSSADGSSSGEDTLDWITDVQISGNTLIGSVGPHPTDYYFFFEAGRE